MLAASNKIKTTKIGPPPPKVTTLIIVAFTCALMIGAAFDSPQNNDGYEGKWWLSLGKQQRAGFVDGYLACYSYEVRGPIKFHYESGQMYAPRLEKYLLHHPEESEMSIEELLWKMNVSSDAPPVPKPHGTPAGPKTGKYGIYDGEFWREVDNPNRLGFVQGFLYCHSKHKTGPKNAFSREPQWYVTAISKWYGIDEKDEGAINPKRANTKIPDALFKFSDTGGRVADR